MNDPTQLVPSSNGSQDLRVALERPLPYPPYGAYPEQVSSGYNRLRDYWRSVRKNIWLVIGIVVLMTLVTAVYMARQPDIYESLSRVQVDLETANNPAIGALKRNRIFLNNPSQDPTYFNTQIQILTSAGLLGRVAKTLDLEHNEAFLRPTSGQKPSIWQSVKRLAGSGQPAQQPKPTVENKLRVGSAISSDDVAEADRLEPYVEMLKSQLSAKPLNDTRIIEIRLNIRTPKLAKINNMMAETFVLSNLERNRDQQYRRRFSTKAHRRAAMRFDVVKNN